MINVLIVFIGAALVFPPPAALLIGFIMFYREYKKCQQQKG